jgi:cystathionine beta-lyase/cystathionine gamma-synthase
VCFNLESLLAGNHLICSAVISPLSPHYVDFSKEMRHIYEDTLFEKDAIRLDDNSMEFESRVRKMNTNAEQLCDYLLQHPRGNLCSRLYIYCGT